jgi:ATP-dependent RNA helicase DDX5/DBP2
VARIPRERQTLFFSATWPREVKHIASQFVTRATVHVFVGAVEDKVRAAAGAGGGGGRQQAAGSRPRRAPLPPLPQRPELTPLAPPRQLVANKSITQHVIICGGHEKMGHLSGILRSKAGQRVIIFCSTKRMCDQLAFSLGREYRAAALHGDKRQQERDYTLAAFKDGRMPVLVATDVAARGLDVKDVAAVINYDMPPGIEDYVHRIGGRWFFGGEGGA